jgi:tetratricopeptide (TPR) repeat protein
VGRFSIAPAAISKVAPPTPSQPLFREALAIGEGSSGASIRIVAVLNNLANLLRDTGRHAEAEPQSEALAISEKSLAASIRRSPSASTYSRSYSDRLAAATEAEQLYREAIAISEDFQARASGRRYLCSVRLAIFQEAEPLLREALTINERRSTQITQTALTQWSLAALFASQASGEALPFAETALAVFEKTLVPSIPGQVAPYLRRCSRRARPCGGSGAARQIRPRLGNRRHACAAATAMLG